MKRKTSRPLKGRIVAAPNPIGLVLGSLPSNRVLSAVLSEDEDVEWTWTTSRGGQYVCGYTIVKKLRELSAPKIKRLKKSSSRKVY